MDNSRRTSERRAVREAGVLPPRELREVLPPLTRGALLERAMFWPAEREGPAWTVVWRRAIVYREMVEVRGCENGRACQRSWLEGQLPRTVVRLLAPVTYDDMLTNCWLRSAWREREVEV